MYRDCSLALDAILDLLITARPVGPGPKRKMAYWFTVLEDLIGQALPATGTAGEKRPSATAHDCCGHGAS